MVEKINLKEILGHMNSAHFTTINKITNIRKFLINNTLIHENETKRLTNYVFSFKEEVLRMILFITPIYLKELIAI